MCGNVISCHTQDLGRDLQSRWQLVYCRKQIEEGHTSQNENINTNLPNQTSVVEFVLTGYPCNFQIRIFLFILFLSMYIMSILGNSFLIFTVIVSPQLHTAMYYFLCNLSVIDLCFTSCTMPKFLFVIFSKTQKISYTGCMTQMYLGMFLVCTENFLLAVMAYDRYVAICLPLHYTTIMSWRVCRSCTVMILIVSFFLCTVPYIVKPFVFCRGNRMDHFACEILGILHLVCGDVAAYKLRISILTIFLFFSPFVFILISYICIIISILKIKSGDGRLRTFSTCASHLTVVCMYYGTCMGVYMFQGMRFSSKSKYVSLIYGVFTPVLNPMIYSLRNNEVKRGFSKILIKYSASRTT